MTTPLPTIVVALYNRTEPALRLLNSIANAHYPEGNINLVISIDNDKNQNTSVVEIAKIFPWEHGPKEVIYHKTNLGIRDHFNFCGDLSQKYGAVIFLEDDLFVSKYYYQYTIDALKFYSNDINIAGISLFSYNRIEQWANPLPFIPIDDGYDTYFLQQASWGQIWTENMWGDFKKWFSLNGDNDKVNALPNLPDTIKAWPGKSWKKYYISYMILNNKYYVFPRSSYVSNFDDVGINRKCNTVYYQSPIIVNHKETNFASFKDSLSIYDSYFEILPEILKKLNPRLAKYDFEMNLYGGRKDKNRTKELIFSKEKGSNVIESFKLSMKPHELNIVFDQKGEGIYLLNPKEVTKKDKVEAFMNDFSYFYREDFMLSELFMIIRYKLRKKLSKFAKNSNDK